MRNETNITLFSDLKLFEDMFGADVNVTPAGDLNTVSEEMNLAQALLHRIRTARGELAELGHPEYGSEILEYVGLPNNWVTRERLRLAIRDAIRQESRVKELVTVTVRPRQKNASVGEEGKIDRATKALGTLVDKLIGRWEHSVEGEDLVKRQESGNLYDVALGKGEDPTELLNSVDVEFVVIPITGRAVRISFPLNLEAGGA